MKIRSVVPSLLVIAVPIVVFWIKPSLLPSDQNSTVFGWYEKQEQLSFSVIAGGIRSQAEFDRALADPVLHTEFVRLGGSSHPNIFCWSLKSAQAAGRGTKQKRNSADLAAGGESVVRAFLTNANGADLRRQTMEELAWPSGGAVDTAPVLREFLKKGNQCSGRRPEWQSHLVSANDHSPPVKPSAGTAPLKVLESSLRQLLL
jgi:hypothetical protein